MRAAAVFEDEEPLLPVGDDDRVTHAGRTDSTSSVRFNTADITIPVGLLPAGSAIGLPLRKEVAEFLTTLFRFAAALTLSILTVLPPLTRNYTFPSHRRRPPGRFLILGGMS